MLILTLISVYLMIGGIIYSDNTLLALSAIIGIISTGILFFGIIGIDMLFDIWREVK
jgi:hypothetical protein